MAKDATPKGKTLTAKFQFKRSTKGTHVYEEIDDAGNEARNVVGSLYIQRAALGAGEAPAKMEGTFKFT